MCCFQNFTTLSTHLIDTSSGLYGDGVESVLLQVRKNATCIAVTIHGYTSCVQAILHDKCDDVPSNI